MRPRARHLLLRLVVVEREERDDVENRVVDAEFERFGDVEFGTFGNDRERLERVFLHAGIFDVV